MTWLARITAGLLISIAGVAAGCALMWIAQAVAIIFGG